ncbi:MAG TPA: bifunctional glutamate N-acetyltransferase/amino-acid acetyltransferase ArgJ [Actinomycetales bacterium]|nr:bifunctional glutamate N-acetyltransferase/amino-acid acetyltransferase ArgJ [Actinomycetales bacterium]
MSVTAPKGFRAAGVSAGIKSSSARDLAVVVNDGPEYTAAGVFTTNRIQAAPVVWTQAQVRKEGTARGVVLNSGGANAATGKAGYADAEKTAQRAAELLQTDPEQVLICSTGLIGVPLPMDPLLTGLEAAHQQLSASAAAGANAAEAIMTTDTVTKTVVVERDGWRVGGIAKGAGMLAPGMATMLVVLTTDASADDKTLDAALRRATKVTFDRVDSDGCMSTNDTVLALASGASEIAPAPEELAQALTEASANLARQLVADAEGATHDIAITVQNASTEMAAVIVARAISRSNLFKAAVFGNDPNWGRIISAAGTIPADIAPFDPQEIDVYVNGVQVCRAGGVGEDRSLVDMSPREVQVVVDLHAGDFEATIWTNDLTHDYVHENSAYSS